MQAFGLARIGRDAEVRFTPKGEPVANLSLAFTYGRKGDDGKRPTQWVDGSLWGKRAEALAQYLTKGALVSVTLEDVAIETFTKADGTPSSKLVARVSNVELAGSPTQAQKPAPAPAPAPKSKPAPSSSFDDLDDSEIPF